MRKKLLAMLLALIMVISVVPMVAMAEDIEEEHDCWDYASQFTYVNNGNGTHTVKCPKDHEVQTAACVWDSGSCICGSTKPVATHDCWDGPFTYEYNGNGTHTVKCLEGHTVQTAACVWESGKCACGSEKPACDHMGNNWKYTNNSDGTHTVTCTDCGEVVTANAACVWESGKCACGAVEPVTECTEHKFIATAGDGKCTVCGYVCDHIGVQTVVDNKDGKTHTSLCPTCGTVTGTKCAHVYDTKTGKCACGAVKPAETCDHVGVQTVVDNKDGKTHKSICPKCGEVVIEKSAHVYDAKTGKCACGAVKPAETCDHVGVQTVVDNKDGKTHKTVCPKCGEVVIEKSEHVYDAKTGKCACGAVKPVETCDHVGVQTVVDNKDGKTHKTICPKCGEIVIEKSEHVYDAKTGKCACGAEKTTVKPTEPKPTEPKPTNPSKPSNNKNDKLDNVPKTGDNGSVILMFGLLITGLFGTAAYVVCTKKKVF